MCVDMCVYMCVDMCTYMCADMCIDICVRHVRRWSWLRHSILGAIVWSSLHRRPSTNCKELDDFGALTPDRAAEHIVANFDRDTALIVDHPPVERVTAAKLCHQLGTAAFKTAHASLDWMEPPVRDNEPTADGAVLLPRPRWPKAVAEVVELVRLFAKEEARPLAAIEDWMVSHHT